MGFHMINRIEDNIRTGYRLGLIFIIFVIAFITAGFASGDETPFNDYSDQNLVALWLFDEPNHPYAILADSSSNQYNLRLNEAGRLVPGKFGNALEVLSESAHAVSFAGIEGSDPSNETTEEEEVPGARLWGPTEAPEEILALLVKGNWTCELWLKLAAAPETEVTIIDLGRAYLPGLTINLTAGAGTLTVVNSYGAYWAECPTNAAKLTDGKWHHLAFTQSTATGHVRHYLDGQAQWFPKLVAVPQEPTPPVIEPQEPAGDGSDVGGQKDDQWYREHRFNLSLGHDRKGERHIKGMMDELRFSKTNRYLANFPVPGSFSGHSDPNDPQAQ